MQGTLDMTVLELLKLTDIDQYGATVQSGHCISMINRLTAKAEHNLQKPDHCWLRLTFTGLGPQKIPCKASITVAAGPGTIE